MLEYIEKEFCDFLENCAEDNEEVTNTDDKLYNYLNENFDRAVMLPIDTLCGYAIYAHEKQGFINGFLWAMKKLGELSAVNELALELTTKHHTKRGGAVARDNHLFTISTQRCE